jgi:hypothetical protein
LYDDSESEGRFSQNQQISPSPIRNLPV